MTGLAMEAALKRAIFALCQSVGLVTGLEWERGSLVGHHPTTQPSRQS